MSVRLYGMFPKIFHTDMPAKIFKAQSIQNKQLQQMCTNFTRGIAKAEKILS